MLSGKKILIGITGSIAAYKATTLCRLLIKQGAQVRVVMTKAACDFVSPLTLSTLTKHRVAIDLFEGSGWENHVELGRWANVIIIAPLSCNTLAKMAQGLCDNLLLAVYLSATCPIIVAPAMDEDMWLHTATRQNVLRLVEAGVMVIPVGRGELASGLFGDGRMAEPDEILSYVESYLLTSAELKGMRALVTAGPTQEPLDPVRFISNYSSGKMGIAIAEALQQRGASVTLVLGPTSEQSIVREIKRVISAEDMFAACIPVFEEYDIIIMAAAVADYRPETVSSHKIKKAGDHTALRLVKNRDILKSAGEGKKASQTLVGFALETNDGKENALLKLKEKNLDLIVLNTLDNNHSAFNSEENKIVIFDKGGNEFNFALKSKKEVANDIINTIIKCRDA